ncbi:MAG: hypothetical protein LBV17_06860 [Treponema sp.]|jgi:hypothetical protein|nr:hypothetical protein [Treponema sp.]
MQENLREFCNKTASAVKKACAKVLNGVKGAVYLLIPVIMLLSAGIIALTQESPFQVDDFAVENEEGESTEDFFSDSEAERIIPEWVKPPRWFRSNAGGMPLEEMKSKKAAMRGEYALVIDFTNPYDLPEYLFDFYDNQFFIEIRTLYRNGEEDRTQWIFRDENYGVRLIAVLFEAAQNTAQEDAQIAAQNEDGEKNQTAPVEEVAAVIQNADSGNYESSLEVAESQNLTDNTMPVIRREPARGFVEVYDEKYHITTEYIYSDKGEKNKIEYSYNNNIKVSAQTMLWDNDKREYVSVYNDYYRYNRSSFLRAVERVFLRDQQITYTDNVVASNVVTNDGVTGNEVINSEVVSNEVTGNEVINNEVANNEVTSGGVASNSVASEGVTNNIEKVSFPQNILAAARNDMFLGERFNSYPEFFGDLFVTKDSKLIFTTDDRGRVLEQTLIGNDEEETVIWKIVNTWSDERIVKITKTEGETALVAEYVYNKKGDRVLERNIKDGVLERVVRTEGKKDIEELYLDNKVVLQAVWEDGRKISESRIIKN